MINDTKQWYWVVNICCQIDLVSMHTLADRYTVYYSKMTPKSTKIRFPAHCPLLFCLWGDSFINAYFGWGFLISLGICKYLVHTNDVAGRCNFLSCHYYSRSRKLLQDPSITFQFNIIQRINRGYAGVEPMAESSERERGFHQEATFMSGRRDGKCVLQ